MTPQQILNADLGVIARWIRLGFAWWGRELADLVPPALRRSPRGARRLARMEADGAIRIWRAGAPEAAPASGRRPGGPVDLLLPPGAALVHDLDLPRLSPPDLRRLVALNVDRYTPFAAEQVYVDIQPLDRPAEGPRQRVRLGVIARERCRALLAQASAAGLKVERIGVGGGVDGLDLRFDFMRAIRDEDGGGPVDRRRAYLWAACGALAAANLGLLVARDIDDVGQLQRLVDAQQPAVGLATKLRKDVEAERAARLALLTKRSAHEPLRILDAVTRALHSGQWVQRLEWNGRAVRLVGFKQPGFDLTAALRGPALAEARSLLSDMPTKTATGQEPFDVMADAAVPRAARRAR